MTYTVPPPWREDYFWIPARRYAAMPLAERLHVLQVHVRIGVDADLASAHRRMTAAVRGLHPEGHAKWACLDIFWKKEQRRKAWVKAHLPSGPCHYCGAPDPIGVDHVIPRTQSGPSFAWNMVRACVRCNSAKGNRTPEQWRAGVRSDSIGGTTLIGAVLEMRRLTEQARLLGLT